MRYKGAYGGRGGAKSHFFAEQCIVNALQGKRIVCIREVQNSIKDSVKQLITDKIIKMGLDPIFTMLESEIRGPNGSMIVFKGMQSYNAANIKSLEGYDIAWVEEAQTMSQKSLNMLRPTLRKEGSELWFSWNPLYKTDPVDVFFRKNPPDNAVSVQINWYDNPWFKDTELYKDMLSDFERDPDNAEHVWNGGYGSSQGAILSKWVNKAEREGRIHNEVEYDPEGAPLIISSDIGFRDTSGWWFWQPCPGGFRVLRYVGNSGLDSDDWIPILKDEASDLGAPIGKIWLPQDAKAKTFQSRHTSAEKFAKAFGVKHVDITPPSTKLDQISAARSIMDQCEFHKDRCEDGLDGLRSWEYEYNDDLGVFSRNPLHNWASHPADSFCYGAQVVKEPAEKPQETIAEFPIKAHNGRIITAKLDDLWDSTPKRRERY